jgi:hypothetical protein
VTAEPKPDFADEPSTLDNLRDLARKLLQVPKHEVEERRKHGDDRGAS